jgi:hypothetical protein
VRVGAGRGDIPERRQAQGRVVGGDGPPWPQKHTHRTTHGGARCVVHLHYSMGKLVRQELSPPSQLYKKFWAPFRSNENVQKLCDFLSISFTIGLVLHQWFHHLGVVP